MTSTTKELEMFATGKACFEKNSYKKAKVIFSELIEINPGNPDPYYYLANIFHINGEIGKAIKAFSKVLELNPGHTDASISLSVLYNDIGKYDEAKSIFDKANEKVKNKKTGSLEGVNDPHINKKFAIKHFELAELYMSYNRFDEALFEYNKSVGLDPEDLNVRLKIAKVYAKKGFISKAIDALKKLKNEYPHFMPARIALGLIYYGNQNIISARQEWERVIARDPFNNEAKMYLNLSKTATETTIN